MNYNLDYVRPSQRALLQPEIEKSYFSDNSLNCKCYENAYVLPPNGAGVGGVAMKNFDFIPTTAFEGFEQRKFDGQGSVYNDCDVIYLGYFYHVWGHYFTDNIKRFWFLYTEKAKKLICNGCRIVFISCFNKEINENGHKLYSMADVDSSTFEHITKITQFRRVYVPDISFYTNSSVEFLSERFYTTEFCQPIQRIREKIKPTIKYDKVYFSRTGLTGYYLREYGEWKIESIFKKKGYEIIRPETLSLEDQLSILANCKHFATTEGSIAHNAIFCSPGTEVVIIRKADYVNYYQLAINQLADLNVIYIDAHRSVPPFGDRHIWAGPFYLCITSYILKWSGQLPFFVPYFLLPSYWWYVLRRNPFVLRKIANRKIVHWLESNYWNYNANKA